MINFNGMCEWKNAILANIFRLKFLFGKYYIYSRLYETDFYEYT